MTSQTSKNLCQCTFVPFMVKEKNKAFLLKCSSYFMIYRLTVVLNVGNSDGNFRNGHACFT